MARYGKTAQEKVRKAMEEKKSGTLKSGRSGKKVTSRKQAVAIGLAEARRAGGKVPAKAASTGTRKKSTAARKTSTATSKTSGSSAGAPAARRGRPPGSKNKPKTRGSAGSKSSATRVRKSTAAGTRKTTTGTRTRKSTGTTGRGSKGGSRSRSA